LGRELEQVLELVSSKDTDRPKKAPDSLEESRASKSCLFLDER
jgi:hypothetical protein